MRSYYIKKTKPRRQENLTSHFKIFFSKVVTKSSFIFVACLLLHNQQNKSSNQSSQQFETNYLSNQSQERFSRVIYKAYLINSSAIWPSFICSIMTTFRYVRIRCSLLEKEARCLFFGIFLPGTQKKRKVLAFTKKIPANPLLPPLTPFFQKEK